MTEDKVLYSWKGQEEKDFTFLHLSKTFEKSYSTAVKANQSSPCIHWISKKGSSLRKTFSEFNHDVESYRSQIRKTQTQWIATLSGNTYENLALMTAILLEKRTLCPLNGDDETHRLQKRFQQLPASTLFLTDRKRDFPFKTYPFEDFGSSETTSIKESPKDESARKPFIAVFTSGSTGDSKIVQQRENGLLANVDALIEAHALHEKKRLATCLPIFHVNALEFSFFGCLFSGSEFTLFENFDFFQALEILEKEEIQIFSAIPSILKTFCGQSQKVLSKSLPLESFVTAASYLSPALARKACDIFSFKIIQGYGLSEAINFSTLLPPSLTKTEIDYWLRTYAFPSIGPALRGNEVFVLDEKNQLVAEGVTGEIALRGINLMWGYKDSDGTEFKNNFFRTGDLGFFRLSKDKKEKYFFIQSRKKDMIKRFGETVSLKEIDDALLEKLSFQGTLISVGFPNETAGEEVGAILFSPTATNTEIENLKKDLEMLPPSLKPRVVLRVQTAPTTESGKPRRWSYVSLFKDYESKILGPQKILWSEE